MNNLDPRKRTRRCLLTATITILLSGGLLYGSMSEAEGARQAHSAAEHNHRKVQEQLQQTKDAAEERARLIPAYQKLIEQSRGEPSDSQSRSKTLLDLQTELRLPALRYEFQPPVTPEGQDEKDFALISQLVKVHLELVHEVDLLHFLQQLPERTGGMIVVRHCQLARLGSPVLSADCEIDWIHLAVGKS